MKRIRPTLQITLALVFLTCTILIIANLLFDVFPEPDVQSARLRSAFAESLATQAAALLQRGDRKGLELTLASIRQQNPSIRSFAVRRADQTLVVQSGDHNDAWKERGGESSTATHVYVPLMNGSQRWGSFEMAYFPLERNTVARALAHPLWVTLLFVALMGTLVYWVYLRRALVHLDPTAVVPERVRQAFDAMTEGVAILDRDGRIMLASKAFRALGDDASSDPMGKPLSALPWLAAGLPADEAQHPWSRTIHEGAPITGYPMELGAVGTLGKKLTVNCAPIADPRGIVRGCLVTFDDLTELHMANERLSEALAELRASRDEIYQKNIELEHLATRDALTGCLTRRAFFERMAQAREDARRNGTSLSCLVLDVDRFKSVNDTFGHAVGDRVIQEVGGQLIASLRATDIISRYGGDEFLVGMPGCDMDQGAAIAEKISRSIEQHCTGGIGRLRVTVSIGVATLGHGVASVADMIEEADKALYAAKSSGRNRVARARSGGPERSQTIGARA